jgi:catechol 2,3-dioxygenase-like lactoylglutathione lyase family enzyme
VRFVYSDIRVRVLARSMRFHESTGFRVLKRGWFSHDGMCVHAVVRGSPHRLELNYDLRCSRFVEPFRRGTEVDGFGSFAPDPRRWLRAADRVGAKPAIGFIDGAEQLFFVRDPDGIWLAVYGPVVRPLVERGAPRLRLRARRPGGSVRPRANVASRSVADRAAKMSSSSHPYPPVRHPLDRGPP